MQQGRQLLLYTHKRNKTARAGHKRAENERNVGKKRRKKPDLFYSTDMERANKVEDEFDGKSPTPPIDAFNSGRFAGEMDKKESCLRDAV